MAYAIITIEKIKTEGSLVSRYKHDYRMVDVPNADPARKTENEILVSLGTNNTGNPANYHDAWKKRISELQSIYGWNHIRTNAVIAYDIVTAVSHDTSLDYEEWKTQNVKWLYSTFGEENVLSAVFHADESTPHIHACVVPVDPNGRLNASWYTDGARMMSALQDSYANAMKTLGLKRGRKNSGAKHEDISHFYSELNTALTLPTPCKNETAIDYSEKIITDIKKYKASLLKKTKDKLTAERMAQDQYNETITKELLKEIDFHVTKEEKLNRQINDYKNKIDELETELEAMADYDELKQNSEEYNYFLTGVDILAQDDPSIYEIFNAIYDAGYDFNYNNKNLDDYDLSL